MNLVLNPFAKVTVERSAAGRPLRFTLRAPVPARGLTERDISASEPELFSLDEAGWRPFSRETGDAAEGYAARGYAVVRDVTADATLGAVQRYYRELTDQGWLCFGDPQAKRYFAHNEPVARALHCALAPLVSAVSRRAVRPSYVCTAVYVRGASLAEHVDRGQCADSLSLAIDVWRPDGQGACWPLWIRDARGRAEALHLHPGDLVVYRGCERPHFREPLADAERVTQIFFHYVGAGFQGPLD